MVLDEEETVDDVEMVSLQRRKKEFPLLNRMPNNMKFEDSSLKWE